MSKKKNEHVMDSSKRNESVFVRFKTMSAEHEVWLNKNQVCAVRRYGDKETKVDTGYSFFILPYDVNDVLDMLR